MGKDSLKFTKTSRKPKDKQLVNKSEIVKFEELEEIKAFRVEYKGGKINVTEKAPPSLKKLYERLGLPTSSKHFILIKKKEPVLLTSKKEICKPKKERVNIKNKKLLFELLTKQQLGLFDIKPVNEEQQFLIESQKRILNKLMDVFVIDDNDIDETFTIKIVGFPQYHNKKPSLDTKIEKFKYKQKREFIEFKEEFSLTNKINDALNTHINVSAHSVLRKIVKNELFEILKVLFRVDENKVVLKQTSKSGQFAPHLESYELYKHKEFLKYCRLQNISRMKEKENEEMLVRYKNVIETPLPPPQMKVEEPLLEKLLSEAKITTTLFKKKVDPQEQRTDIIFERFLQTHDEFYSIFSFINGKGIYEMLREQPYKNIIDVYVMQSIEKRNVRYEKLMDIPSTLDFYDPSVLKDMQRKTYSFIKQIIRSYIDTTPPFHIIEEYITQVRAQKCEYFESKFEETESIIKNEWLRLFNIYTLEKQQWDTNQELYKNSKKQAEVSYENDVYHDIKSQIDELERSIYEESGKIIHPYLAAFSFIYIALDSNNFIGKYANIFRFKVIKNVYPIRYLNKLNVSDVYLELLMNKKLFETTEFNKFQLVLNESVQRKMHEILIKYLYSSTLYPERYLYSAEFEYYLKEFEYSLDEYVVKPQDQCVNKEENIQDDDLIVCLRDNKFYCYSLSKLSTLFSMHVSEPIDPYTDKPFTNELILKILSRLE